MPKSEAFTAASLADAKKKRDQWLALHKVTVVKEHNPLVTRTPAGRFAPKSEGKVTSVTINLEYEDSN